MNRRGFLKRCSILPFIGSLSAVAKAESKVKITKPFLREAGLVEMCVVKADFYERFAYRLREYSITDYVWASKQGWSWSKGYRDRAIEMSLGRIPSGRDGKKMYREIPTKVKGISYKVYELTLFQDNSLVCLLYVFSTGVVIRAEVLAVAANIMEEQLKKDGFPKAPESKKCSCPAPYIADVTKAPVRHFRSCDKYALAKALQDSYNEMGRPISPSAQMRLAFKNPKLDIPESREWLDKVEEIVNAKFIANPPYVMEWGTNKRYYLNEKVRS